MRLDIGDDCLLAMLRHFRARLEQELTEASSFLRPSEVTWFRNYVRSRQLLEYTPQKKRWLDQAYARQVGWVLERIQTSERPLRVLDAGCGLGTESILFASLGASVVGVDLWEENLQVARNRVHHWEQVRRGELDLRFLRTNLFRYSPGKQFDIIYVREAISHIHPIGEFFQLCHQYLVPGADLVICDSNARHPYIRYTVWRARGTREYTEVADPDTGEAIPYAVERVFPLSRMTQYLEGAGFTIVHSSAFGFVPVALVSVLPYGWLHRLSQWLQSSRVTASLGTRYTVVGRKVDRVQNE